MALENCHTGIARLLVRGMDKWLLYEGGLHPGGRGFIKRSIIFFYK